MGYGGVSLAYVMSVGGLPAPLETTFMVEGAMNRVMPESEDQLRVTLKRLDTIDDQLFCDRSNLAAERIGDITVNLKQLQMLRQEYLYWRSTLAAMLMVPPNPHDPRFGLGGGINIPVG
jgi:hypothetical protein